MYKALKTGKLKVGILLNSFDVPHWVFKMLESLIISQTISIEVLIIKEKEKNSKSIKNNYLSLLPFIVFTKLDELAFKNSSNDIFKLVDIRKISPIIQI